MRWERTRVLVTVKAYPTISDVGENVCVAGVKIEEGTWIRLYPLPFRDLPREKQFKKYATIEVDVRKSKDPRPESYVPNVDTLRVVAPPLPAGTWKRRTEVIVPMVATSMCAIMREQESSRTSLGLFRPGAPPELVIQERQEQDWSDEKRMVIEQGQLLDAEKWPLEWIPYRFLYKYRCADEPACNGHQQTIVDWEIAEAYRGWRQKYGPQGVLDEIRKQWSSHMWGPTRDSYLYTGNQLARPTRFLVLGVLWPPKPKTPTD